MSGTVGWTFAILLPKTGMSFLTRHSNLINFVAIPGTVAESSGNGSFSSSDSPTLSSLHLKSSKIGPLL